MARDSGITCQLLHAICVQTLRLYRPTQVGLAVVGSRVREARPASIPGGAH